MIIREARNEDFDGIWSIFHKILATEDAYVLPKDTSKEEGHHYWMASPEKVFVAEEDGMVLGAFYIRTNQPGRGGHVCNCGYIVGEGARGRGLAGAMYERSEKEALDMGYRAMQYNYVLSTNTVAVRLWKKKGFEIVGTLPMAYDHPSEGYVDVYLMYKWLSPDLHPVVT